MPKVGRQIIRVFTRIEKGIESKTFEWLRGIRKEDLKNRLRIIFDQAFAAQKGRGAVTYRTGDDPTIPNIDFKRFFEKGIGRIKKLGRFPNKDLVNRELREIKNEAKRLAELFKAPSPEIKERGTILHLLKRLDPEAATEYLENLENNDPHNSTRHVRIYEAALALWLVADEKE